MVGAVISRLGEARFVNMGSEGDDSGGRGSLACGGDQLKRVLAKVEVNHERDRLIVRAGVEVLLQFFDAIAGVRGKLVLLGAGADSRGEEQIGAGIEDHVDMISLARADVDVDGDEADGR